MAEVLQLVSIAEQIREILLAEFPDNKVLSKQCKRASILVDLWCKKNKVKSYIKSGHITKPGDENTYDRGHVWNIIIIEGKKYLIDITLTQFQGYIGKLIPTTIVLEERLAKQMYFYTDDNYNKYYYRRDDVRQSLVNTVMAL